MSWIAVAAITTGGSLISGAMGADAARSAASKTAKATKAAARIQERIYQQQRADLAPYREQGYTALQDIAELKPFLTSQFDEEQLERYLDPSMAFRMKYGTQAAERLANVGGGALSGNTLRALTEFGQGLASTEYGNAFNRAQTERQNIYNILGNIAGMGQGAVNTGVQAGQAYGQNLGQLTVGSAQALGAGQVGTAQAYGNALGNITDVASLYGLAKSGAFGRTPMQTAAVVTPAMQQTTMGQPTSAFMNLTQA